ncbi:MAG: GAF domain-containing protein [Candidatus Eremiobacteraeota bacterium]|nr:GAF domain-containing protein [Candidatus Eremiobacteraeota bacterium]
MSKRAVALGLAAAGIPLALLVLVLPLTWGYGGFKYDGIPRTNYGTVTYVDPAGPAAKAGLREGDRVLLVHGVQYIIENAGPVDTVAVVQVVDGRRIRDVRVTMVPFTGNLGLEQRINKIVSALTALGAFALAIVILLRGRDRRVAVRSANVLLLAGALGLSWGGALVCYNAFLAEALFSFVPTPLGLAVLWASVAVLAIFPPPVSRLRRALVVAGGVAFAYELYGLAAYVTFIVTGVIQTWPLTAGFFGRTGDIVSIVLVSPLLVACIDALVTSDEEHAPATRWLCSLWIVAWAFVIAPDVLALAGSRILFTHYGDLGGAVSLAFLALGIAYPILRHRLVDLNILISRATVFTIVSLILVAIFVAVEWGAAKVMERALGVSADRGDTTSQAITLVLVIVLGLSARSIHRFVDNGMMRAFFRKRLEGLAQIQSCADEIDVATDMRPVAEIAVATVMRSLDVRGCAIYLRREGAYLRAIAAGEMIFPERYGFNDVPALKLRRWRRHIELDESSSDMLFLPMLVRGDLLGFIVCGAKIDRTVFLDDEIAALTLLAHHVGLAEATLDTPQASIAAPSRIS